MERNIFSEKSQKITVKENDKKVSGSKFERTTSIWEACRRLESLK
jgi:hypothetical protein